MSTVRSAQTVAVNIDTLERAVQALDTAVYFGVGRYEPDDQDRAQVRASYEELAAITAEHTEIEEDV